MISTLTNLPNYKSFATEAVKHNVFPLRDTSLRISGIFRVPSALGKGKDVVHDRSRKNPRKCCH